MDLQCRVKRDHENARTAKVLASNSLEASSTFRPQADFVHGTPKRQLDIATQLGKEKSSLLEISREPFHAMVEAIVNSGEDREVLWYANEHTLSNVVLEGKIQIVAWTHKGFQLALVGKLDEELSINRDGLALKSVIPLARAKFKQVLPEISGVYDPGGRVRPEVLIGKPTGSGLKVIKFDLTTEQVFAFVGRMDGYLLVTGAPGTGKTTVALQRIRFLFDQQSERDPDKAYVPYAPELTAVFLANPNLINYSRRLLKEELQIPERVVHLVPEFVQKYLERVWVSKQNARPRLRKLPHEEQRAREAFFHLCLDDDLSGMWLHYEKQIKTRMVEADRSEWYGLLRQRRDTSKDASALMQALNRTVRAAKRPGDSGLRMDTVFRHARGAYDRCREPLRDLEKKAFDLKFRNWLFWVYDPLESLKTYFTAHRYQGQVRIQKGTNTVDADEIISGIERDWSSRMYGPEEEAWLAWMLRFALPEERLTDDHFRDVPVAIPDTSHESVDRYTHVVIDEAQDLSVPEASLLTSLVHPRGSLTVSADFHQVVSPVHGMVNAEALKFGMPIIEQDAYKRYPFTKNMRQSREIGMFLLDFHKKVFHEFPKFDAGDRVEGVKPVLYTGPTLTFPKLIQQMVAVLSRSKRNSTLALVQVNEDELAMNLLRDKLSSLGVRLARPHDLVGAPGRIITTDVEHAKGLEFDACMILGLDDCERSALNFSINRAYVALSRPTLRLFMLCEQFPPLLEKVERDLYDRHEIK